MERCHFFVIRKNYFFALYFCFKNLDLLDQQTTQFDFSLSTLFVIFTSCDLKLYIKFLHSKQFVVPSSFPVVIGFIFDFMLYNVGSIFLTKYLICFDVIEILDTLDNSRQWFFCKLAFYSFILSSCSFNLSSCSFILPCCSFILFSFSGFFTWFDWVM